jgi:hypothetical protein
VEELKVKALNWLVWLSYADAATQAYTFGSLLFQLVGAAWSVWRVGKATWGAGVRLLGVLRRRRVRKELAEAVRLRKVVRGVLRTMGQPYPPTLKDWASESEVELALDEEPRCSGVGGRVTSSVFPPGTEIKPINRLSEANKPDQPTSPQKD